MKFHPVGAELLHAHRRTDMTKLIVAFRNFAKAPKNFSVFQDSNPGTFIPQHSHCTDYSLSPPVPNFYIHSNSKPSILLKKNSVII